MLLDIYYCNKLFRRKRIASWRKLKLTAPSIMLLGEGFDKCMVGFMVIQGQTNARTDARTKKGKRTHNIHTHSGYHLVHYNQECYEKIKSQQPFSFVFASEGKVGFSKSW